MHNLLDRVTKALADRFTVEREIGRGGMATIYLAVDRKHERHVAIKVLHPELAESIGADRFLREIKLTAQLNHPHILALLDSGEVDGLLYYAMPFVAGESLRDRLKREKQLPIADALHIAREIADALDHAHRAGVVHRDIKPENVLLKDGHAVVADFGIARALSTAAGASLTATGVTVGTPEYMSPEQVGGDGGLDGRSEVYAAGCVLYEMLAGQPPFTGVSSESVVRQHLAAEPRPISAVRAGVPEPVVAALNRALAKAPADRFASAREFGDALVRLPNVRMSGVRKWITSRYRLIGTLVIAIAVAIASVSMYPRPRRPTAVVVRPFVLQNSDSRYLYFANALQEELISLLGRIPHISPTERPSILTYQRDTAAGRIAKDFAADFVIDGTVERSREQVKVFVKLFDPYTNEPLFDSTYVETVSAASLSEIQADIAQRVADALEIRIDAEVRGRISGRPTENAVAYDLFLDASRLAIGYNIADNVKAEALLIQAGKLDPRSNAIRARLAYVYAARAYTLGRPRKWADSALALAAAAVSEDSTLLSGFHALGFAHLELGHLEAARLAFIQALSLRPSDGQSHLFLGWLCFLTGDFSGAVEQWADTKRVDPMNPTVPADMSLVEQVFGNMERARQWHEERQRLQRKDTFGGFGRPRLLLLGGDSLRALREAEKQLAVDTTSYQALAVAAEMATAVDSFELARRHFEAMNRIAPDDWTFWGTTPRTSYAYVLRQLRFTNSADSLLKSTLDSAHALIRRGDQRAGVRREIAAIYTALGKSELSRDWLDSAITSGWRHEQLEPSPWITQARANPDFQRRYHQMETDIEMKRTAGSNRLGPPLPQR